MKPNFVTTVILLFLTTSSCYSQKVDSAALSKICNSEYLPYRDKKGNLLGCGYKLECFSMKVIFYDVNVDFKKRRMQLRGRVISPHIENDTAGEFCYIFLARTVGEKLQNTRILMPTYGRSDSDKNVDAFPYRTGDFILDFVFSGQEKLFFNSPWCKPIEYRVGELLAGGKN